VKRRLLPFSAFLRAAKRIAKRDPFLAGSIQAALELLAEDAFHPEKGLASLAGG